MTATTPTQPELTIGLPECWTITFRPDGSAIIRNYETGDGGTLPAETFAALRTALAEGDAA